MASVKQTGVKRGEWSGGKLLTGSLLQESSVTVFITRAEETPKEWKNAWAIHFTPEVAGCRAMSLNKTNQGRLVDLIGDDTDEWPGYDVTLVKVRVPDPRVPGSTTWGLEVESVKKSKRKLPKAADDVPF